MNKIIDEVFRYLHTFHLDEVHKEYFKNFKLIEFNNNFVGLNNRFMKMDHYYNSKQINILQGGVFCNIIYNRKQNRVCYTPSRYCYTSGIMSLVYPKTDFLKNTGENYIRNINVFK